MLLIGVLFGYTDAYFASRPAGSAMKKVLIKAHNAHIIVVEQEGAV